MEFEPGNVNIAIDSQLQNMTIESLNENIYAYYLIWPEMSEYNYRKPPDQ